MFHKSRSLSPFLSRQAWKTRLIRERRVPKMIEFTPQEFHGQCSTNAGAGCGMQGAGCGEALLPRALLPRALLPRALLPRALVPRALLPNREVFSNSPGFWIENIGKSPMTPSFVEDAKLFWGWRAGDWRIGLGNSGWGLVKGDGGDWFVLFGTIFLLVAEVVWLLWFANCASLGVPVFTAQNSWVLIGLECEMRGRDRSLRESEVTKQRTIL
jgi:hypothetical protein